VTGEPRGQWRQLALIAVVILLVTAPWFSVAAVAPALVDAWQLTGLQPALLTVSVQLGFVVGALLVAATGAADVIPARYLMFFGALAVAAANAAIALWARDFGTALPLRALTGLAMAALYPPALKLIASWFSLRRGLAVGILVGGLTVGSALPQLFRAFGAAVGADWQAVVLAASVAALLGGLLALLDAREGPLHVPGDRFSLEYVRRAFGEPSVRLANLGYLGHMWEVYAMWTWVPAFLAASFVAAGTDDPAVAAGAAFAVVAVGGIGCAVAGAFADRLGRTTVTMSAMALSGSCALLIGLLFGAPPAVTVVLGLVWGLTVVADSAQFSTAVSELAPPGTAGSALALQSAAGFALTGITILLVGALTGDDPGAWRWAFALLAIGPAVGIWAMGRLRRLPEASRMAAGNR
jgi:MFS family permease